MMILVLTRWWGATPRQAGRSKRIVRMVCALAALLSAGCPATSEEVRPPSDQFYFPTGMAISPDQELMFVANANSDLRYDGSTVIPVSLDRLDAVVNEWLSTGSLPSGRVQRLKPPQSYLDAGGIPALALGATAPPATGE